jgi:hypothetical protein
VQSFLMTNLASQFRGYLSLVLAFLSTCETHAAQWSISSPTSVLIDATTIPIFELSGVTYIGPTTIANHHQFIAVQDAGGKLISLEVEISPSGGLLSARAAAALTLSANMDFEGIAYTNPLRGSVFLAEENGPGVREYDLTTGSELQSVEIPNVFNSRRGNLGFESLARSADGKTMWTGNEEALTVDGPRATAAVGTTVRLLRMNVDGNEVFAAEQYAYPVDPIHVAGLSSQRRSGLTDLVSLPDGTLLALERSFDVSLSSPIYRSRIYEIDFTDATDVSTAPWDIGLIGQAFVSVGKELLWSGQAGGGSGQNLEGLTLGPRLANGNWLLVGVVDNSNGADPFSANTLVAFELSAHPSADFDGDGNVDGRDFLTWQRGYGISIGATFAQGDADRDGDVDANDLAIWTATYGSSDAAIAMVPEPTTVTLILLAAAACISRAGCNYMVSLAW